MWFIDDSFVKNRNYYREQAQLNKLPNVTINILYGEELFDQIFSRVDVWREMCSHLSRNKHERSSEMLYIPDLDTSYEILESFQKLRTDESY